MKDVQEKESIIGVRDRSLVMPDCDPEGRIFLSIPHIHDRFW